MKDELNAPCSEMLSFLASEMNKTIHQLINRFNTHYLFSMSASLTADSKKDSLLYLKLKQF